MMGILGNLQPENLDPKFSELRGYVFGSHKHPFEEGYNKDLDIFTMTEMINKRLNDLAAGICTTARFRLESISFLGEIIERMIKLEVNMKGHDKATVKTIKESEFRQ